MARYQNKRFGFKQNKFGQQPRSGPKDPVKNKQWFINQKSKDENVKKSTIFAGTNDTFMLEKVLSEMSYKVIKARAKQENKLYAWDLIRIALEHMVGEAKDFIEEYFSEVDDQLETYVDSISEASELNVQKFFSDLRAEFKKPNHTDMILEKLAQVKQEAKSLNEFKSEFFDIVHLLRLHERLAKEAHIVHLFQGAVNVHYFQVAQQISKVEQIRSIKELPVETIAKFGGEPVKQRYGNLEKSNGKPNWKINKNGKNKVPKCKIHPNGKHTNEDCYVQQGKAKNGKFSKNKENKDNSNTTKD
ncbi:hypothetical protein KGF57_003765 [Candida theae]|uniref:Retrotransposon gag domain-containing protein n=1 Tax=Candida theae TaxID=1198502 RepID=A0AAD5BC85_9ASCO|nr:uncharacterized protein KGF57_003765 [Candida theae]KAI5954742.1 hypothetical protein KGF57_003765 [Candida theae]